MMNGHEGWFGFGGGFMWLIWILIIVVLVFVLKAMFGSGGSGISAGPRTESPLDILKKRFARGEIDEEEYNRRREELEK